MSTPSPPSSPAKGNANDGNNTDKMSLPPKATATKSPTSTPEKGNMTAYQSPKEISLPPKEMSIQSPPSSQAKSNTTDGKTPEKTPTVRIKPFVRKQNLSPKNEKQPSKGKTQNNEVSGTFFKGEVVGYTITKTWNGESAYFKHIKDNSELLMVDENIQAILICPTVDSAGKMQWRKEMIICHQNAEPGDIVAAMKKQGDAIAKTFEKVTPPYKKGSIIGATVKADYTYTKNDEPITLSLVVGNRNAAQIVSRLFTPYLADGTFFEQANDIIPIYFHDADIAEIKKMIKYEYGRMED